MVDTTKKILEASLTWLSICLSLRQAHEFPHSRNSMVDLDSAVSSDLIEKVGNAMKMSVTGGGSGYLVAMRWRLCSAREREVVSTRNSLYFSSL